MKKRKKNPRLSGMILMLLLAAAITFAGCSIAEPVNADFAVTEEVSVLKLEIGAADIRIEEGNPFRVSTDNPYITVEVRNGTLAIRERPHIADLESSEVVISIPAGTVFREVDMKIGAGRMGIDALDCRNLELELGAGQTVIHRLNVTGEADITGGAGQVLIFGGTIHNLDLKHGVGESAITAVLTGQSEIEAGVGSLELIIPAPQTDYTVRTETGIGAVSVNGELAGTKVIGSGPNSIRIAGGIGQVSLTFSGEAET